MDEDKKNKEENEENKEKNARENEEEKNQTRVGLFTARIELLVPLGRDPEDVPFHAGIIVVEIDPHLHRVLVGHLVHVLQIHLEERGGSAEDPPGSAGDPPGIRGDDGSGLPSRKP